MRFRNLVARGRPFSSYAEFISDCNGFKRVAMGFDWHGTLFRLYPHHFLDPLNKVCRVFGHKQFADLSESKSVLDSLSRIVGVNVEQIEADPTKYQADKEKLIKAILIYKASYQQNTLSKLGIMPGVIQTLDELKARNIELFVISNHMQDLLVHDIRALGLIRYFSYVIGAQDPTDYKPGIIMFNRLLKSLHSKGWSSTDRYYYVGDQASDITAAKNSGFKSVLVNDRHLVKLHPRPDYWITDMSELSRLLPREHEQAIRGI